MSPPKLLGVAARPTKFQKQNSPLLDPELHSEKNADLLPSSSNPPVPPELVAIQDELDWLLDGLPSPSCFQDLLHLLFSNKGRALVVQRATTAQLIVDRLEGLSDSLYSDASVRRAAACALLTLTLCGKISVFTSETTMSLVKRLMLDGVLESGAASKTPYQSIKSDINVAKIMGDRNVCRFVPREVSASPLCVCLACLAYCVEPRENYDASKIKVNMGPLLDVLVSTMVEESGALNDPNPTLKTVVSLWKLKTTLQILEQACFACEENQRMLNEKRVETGCPPLEKVVGFNQFLVGLIRTLASHNRRLPSEGIKKDCFLLLISVLMNTTEGDAGACQEVETEHVSRCLIKLWNDGNQRERSHVDEMSALLGVLINVVDEVGCDDICQDAASRSELVDVLCSMTKASGLADEETNDSEPNDGVVTVESLDRRDARQVSSTEAYSSILLGFLVTGNTEVRERVVANLGGVAGVKASIERTLAFYVSVQAVTKRTTERLSVLIQALAREHRSTTVTL